MKVRTGGWREDEERERESERRSWISILESIGRRDVHVFTGDMRGNGVRSNKIPGMSGQSPENMVAMVLAYSTRPRRGSQGHSA